MKFLLLVFTLGCTHLLYAQQGIKGKIEWISGNQMPGPGKIENGPTLIVREVYIYEATTLEQTTANGVFFSNPTTRLVKVVKSKKDGRFCTKLPPGNYSVFVKEKDGLFANAFDSQNCIQCISVKKGSFTQLKILVNYAAAY